VLAGASCLGRRQAPNPFGLFQNALASRRLPVTHLLASDAVGMALPRMADFISAAVAPG